MVDLVTWINQTATIVTNQVPLQSLDDAVSLAEAYLSNIGGWIPQDSLHPNGQGVPANGFTQQQAADVITTQEFDSVYDINFTINVTLDVQHVAKLSDGLDLATAATSMANQLIDFVTNGINASNLPLRVNSTGAQASISGRSDLTGFTSQSIRQTITSDIAAAGVTKLVDFKATTLLYARNTYGLNNTWSVFSFYTEPDQPIVVLIKKYTDNTCATLDGGSTRTYVLSISPSTYAIVSGVILD